MKKINQICLLALIALSPTLVSAQWSAVRFDSANIFRNIFAATPNDVFSTGTDPNFGEYFLLRSDDGGTTWDSIVLNTGADDYQVYELFFADANNGFIGGRKNNATQNMQKTIDNGTTWTDITPDPSSIETISSIYFLDANAGWATSGQNLYITVNGGTSWTSADMNFYAQDIYFTNTLDGFAAGGDTMSLPAYVMKTVDGGLTWTPVLTNTDGNVFVNSNNYLNVVDANTMFTAQEWTNKLYRTTDAGATWDTIICDSAYTIVDFHFESADSGHVLTDMGQLFYTNDAGATWNLGYSAEWGLYGPSVIFFSLNFSQGVGYVCGSSGLIKRFDKLLSGVSEMNTEPSPLTIFPNPCYRLPYFSIGMKGLVGESIVVITNSIGQIVFEETIQNSEMNEFHDVAIAEFAAGMYSVVMMNQNQTRTNKLIIAD